MVEVRVRRLPHAVGLPGYASAGAAGADLHSAEPGPVVLPPGTRAAIATGLVVELPPGHEAQIRPRSGLALHHGLTVVNAPGTVDSDFRGEVRVLLVNLGSEAVTVERGDRIAQMVVAPVTRATFVDVDRLAESERGPGGFGSTGR